jgi:salicylate hydroxylase
MTTIVVVGGGIGGLTAAAAMERTDFEVVVIARAPRYTTVGAGVQLGPHATRVLDRLGMEADLHTVAVAPTALQFRRWADGRILDEQNLGSVGERFGSPYYTLYRPDLIDLLASRLETADVRLGTEVRGIECHDDGSYSVLTAAGQAVHADLLVGADGIHSRVRADTVGDVPARYSGMAAYRALIRRERVEGWQAGVVRNWLGPDRHLVAYPVGRDGAFVNIVAVVPATQPPAESWTSPGSASDLRQHFAGWCPDVGDLLAAVEDPVYQWGLFDREPLPSWSTARSTLIGDSCHPMLPFLAQGAAQAIGDAACLAACLDAHPDDVTKAVDRYELIRRPHTAVVQRQSWNNNVMFHLPDGPDQEARDKRMADADDAEGLATLEWLFAVDPTAIDLGAATTSAREEQHVSGA